jgi:hypothetical protein
MSGSNAVNRPTDTKVKESDINNKLQLFGIYSAFANGKVPSNKQIDISLNSALASKALSSPSKKLSPDGQRLVQELRIAIEQAKFLFLSKNDGNVLQDFIWHTEQLSGGNATTPSAPVDKDTAAQHGQDVLQGLRTLGTLIISNGQFRKLLSDATILLRDMAGDAATNAAQRVRPSEDRLKTIDHPAEDNTWHDVPTKDGIKSQIKSQVNKQTPLSRDDLQDAAGDATQAAHPTGSRDPADAARLAEQDRQQGTSSGVDGQAGVRSAIGTLQDRASANIPDEHKERGKQYVGKTKDYLNDKMPQERRDQTIWRLKKMVVEIQGHQDYQQAINTLLDLAETYGGHGKNLASQGVDNVKGAHDDDHLVAAEKDLRILIERFANSTSLDSLFDAINDIYRDADRDPELKKWFRQLDSYIRRVLKEQGYILQDAATDEWNQLYDRGQFLLRDRYRGHTDRIVDEFQFIGNQFAEDPQNVKFGDAMQTLFNDLGNDENGKPVFKPHLVKDLTQVIIPEIFENVRYVPIPRIEYTDPMMDAIVENLVIESDNLMPNVFEIGNDMYFRWGRKHISSSNRQAVMVSASGIQCDLRDVSYYVNKKQGFPSIKDTGLADIFMGGSGFSFKLKLASAEKKDQAKFFKVEKVDVDVKHLNIKLKKSNHKLLFNLFKPLLFKVIRPVIQKVLEQQIRQSFGQLDQMAFEINQEAQKIQSQLQDNPEDAPNIYSRYYQAAQQRALKGKKKAEAVASDKKVNVAVTKQDSIFQNISLPGGISTKATEYRELAAKGDKWESPVFTLGTAKESSNIPKVAPITRKNQGTSRAGLNGPNSDLPADDRSGQSGGIGATQASSGSNTGGYGSEPRQPGENTFLDYRSSGGNAGSNGAVTNGSAGQNIGKTSNDAGVTGNIRSAVDGAVR